MAITYAQVEAIRFLAICFGVGAGVGLIRGIVLEVKSGPRSTPGKAQVNHGELHP